jgi:hypothetical protein
MEGASRLPDARVNVSEDFIAYDVIFQLCFKIQTSKLTKILLSGDVTGLSGVGFGVEVAEEVAFKIVPRGRRCRGTGCRG